MKDLKSVNVLNDYCNEQLKKQEAHEKDYQARARKLTDDNTKRFQSLNDKMFDIYKDDYNFSKDRALKSDDFVTQEKCYSDMKFAQQKMENLREEEMNSSVNQENEAKYEYYEEKAERKSTEDKIYNLAKAFLIFEVVKEVVVPVGKQVIKKFGPKFLELCSKKLSLA